jgi:TPR repeat protein
VKWYRKAALQGHSTAQHNLGVMYGVGQGVPRDHVEAMKWYRMAAEQGDAGALFNLGIMYGAGKGVTQDYVQAHMWFNLAASRGNETGARNREFTAKKMTPDDISAAQRMTREWLEKHPRN